jgi:hypothetical protein
LRKFCLLNINIEYIDIDIMAFHQNAAGENFKNPNLGVLGTPATIVDRCGRILIWYLPNLMPYVMQVREILY